MGKKYIQYCASTGCIFAVTSGKMKVTTEGIKYTEKPDVTLLPAGVALLEVDDTVETSSKRINVVDLLVEAVPKTDFELFIDNWSHARIIEYVLDPIKLDEFITEATKHKGIISGIIYKWPI